MLTITHKIVEYIYKTHDEKAIKIYPKYVHQ